MQKNIIYDKKQELIDKNRIGCLSKDDIYEEILKNEIQILPFKKQNLTGLGYNLTPSDFVFSTSKKILLEVETNKNEKYVMIPPNDTVLILSKEYIAVSGRIMGTFHSGVRRVSQGLGHISTTLDPGWKGPLLVAVNNPSKKKIKFLLQSDGGRGLEDVSFVTLIFQYLNTGLKQTEHDNKAFRVDVLWQYYMGSSYTKRAYNKSFKLLNEIIETTRLMSPENSISEVDTTEYSRLSEFLVNRLANYDRNQNIQEMINTANMLEYGFVEVISSSSEVFAWQIKQVREQLEKTKQEPTEESAEWLYFYIKILVGGCIAEKKNKRWAYYMNMLEKKMSSYRISKRMRLTLLWHRKWAAYVKCLIGGILMAGLAWICLSKLGFAGIDPSQQTELSLLVAVLTALAGEMFAFFLNHFLREKE